jgi:DNA adenine methylase
MRYLGGKSKIAKRITDTILKHTKKRELLYEPFIGGGAVTAQIAQYFNTVKASDCHEDLIMMWNALQDGWCPPTNISEDTYLQLRNASPSPLRAFAGFGGASWGGKWFGGYARSRDKRNYAEESRRSLLRDIQKMQNVVFDCCSYEQLQPDQTSVVYADPPYFATTQYRDSFDSIKFWKTMDAWVDSGISVFVSEYTAPDHWEPILEIERTRDMKSKLTNAEQVCERVFSRNWVLNG